MGKKRRTAHSKVTPRTSTSTWEAAQVPVVKTPEQIAWDAWVLARGPTPVAKTELDIREEGVIDSLQGWPWPEEQDVLEVSGKLLTLAPYQMNAYIPGSAFSLPETNRKQWNLPKAMVQHPEIAQMILQLVFGHHDSAWKFGATCQTAFNMVSAHTDHWDMNEGYFGRCEERQTEGPQSGNQDEVPPMVGPVLVISPVRGPKGDPSYSKQILNLHNMCIAVNNFAESFQVLQLHRVAFLDIHVLKLLIPVMTNLQALGIYQCQLINVGDGLELLKVIRTDRPKGKEDQVKLDWAPNHHIGPVLGSKEAVSCGGGYGATWNNWGKPTDIGIWAITCCLIRQAALQQQDLLSTHTAFRQWLDKQPLRFVPETLALMVDPDPDLVQLAALVEASNGEHGGDPKLFMHPRGTYDRNHPSMNGYNWAIQTHQCPNCQNPLLGIYFGILQLREHGCCMGCDLTSYLQNEIDHYKHLKRGVISEWLLDNKAQMAQDESLSPEWNTNDLSKALRDFNNENVQRRIGRLQARRDDHMTQGYDRERHETQRELSKKEKYRYGMCSRSPMITDVRSTPNVWNTIADISKKNGPGLYSKTY